jgi:hypothetical protein
VADGSSEPAYEGLRRLLLERAGLDLVTLAPIGAGESRMAFWVTDRAGHVSVLKIMPDGTAEAVAHLQALDAVQAQLRARGYPAPQFAAVGQLPGLVVWIQQRLPGSPLDCGWKEPDRMTLTRLLPELLRLNDAQAGLGTGQRNWPDLLTQTLTTGGDGYCVHYDFTPANLLSDGTAITGVIDINPPVLAGDRAFDLATLLFYRYDHEDIRSLLRARLLDLAGPRAAGAYLAHMVLRQVDWSLRHHPAAAATRRHLHLARIITADLDNALAR